MIQRTTHIEREVHNMGIKAGGVRHYLRMMFVNGGEELSIIIAKAKEEEREACVEVCKRIGEKYMPKHLIMRMGADDCAEAISNRSNKPQGELK